MKSLFRLASAALLTLSVAACTPREQTLVLLSTNDIHAKIERFPALASAVAACRDTVDNVVLLDAGDRWTGNAYVDLAPTPGMPILSLMNRLRYDVVTLGNHEFDHGQAFLGRICDSVTFDVVCANVVSDTCTFPQLPPYVVLERGGIRIGVVGAVTNYEGPGHPAGHTSSFVGLEFPDPQQRAAECAAELRPKVDVLVLLSHMGHERDAELLARETRFDVVVGGHTHKELDTLVNGTLLTQTGKNLKNVGVTTIRLRKGKVAEADFRLVPLDGYAPDTAFRAEVDRYYADERLKRPVGSFAAQADKVGLANWMAAATARSVGAEVGFYHIGGVRLDSLAAGSVGVAAVYDLEPFGTEVAAMRMTPRQMERMIVAKYNETTGEGHRLDMVATTSYEILVDEADNAVGVRFPGLRDGRSYRVSVSDYIYKNYPGLEFDDGAVTGVKVADVLLEELNDKSPLRPDNTLRQQVVRPETR